MRPQPRSMRSYRRSRFVRLAVQMLETRLAPAVLFSDSINRADVTGNPNGMGQLDDAYGPTPPSNYYYEPIWPSISGGPGTDLVSNALQNRFTDYGGVQFTTGSSSNSGVNVGQNLNIQADLYVPKTATGYATQAGIYFRSRSAFPGDGILGGTSAGYWVRLTSTGNIDIRPANTSPGFEAWTARPTTFNSTIFHTMVCAFNGTTNGLQVSLDGHLQTFYSALDGGLTTTVSIPATQNGTNDGTAGVSFGAESNRGQVGGQRTDNIIVSSYSLLTGLPVDNYFTNTLDFGDAPDAGFGRAANNYNTFVYDNGPSHVITPNLRMGATNGGENNASQNATASGDSSDDGISGALTYFIGGSASAQVNVTNTTGSVATLYGWIDYNGDGAFDNATERASIAVPTGTVTGNVTLNFPVVPGGSASSTFARFRLSTDAASANAQGLASDGEVEDYPVSINQSTTSVVLSGGNLLIDDVNGANTNDNITLKLVGANLRISDATNTVGAGTGAAQIDTKTVEVPLTSVTGYIWFTGQAGNDTFTLDLTGGNIFPTGGIKYDGGNPTTGPGDQLVISGGSQATVTYSYTNAHDGSVAMSAFGTVSYTGLEPIKNTGTATDIVFNLPAGPNNSTLGDDTSSGNGLSRLSGSTFEQTDFANPTNSLKINRGNAADSITVNALPDFNRALTSGSSTAPFGSATIGGNVTLASGFAFTEFCKSLQVNANVSVTLAGAGAASITATNNVSLASGAKISTVDGGLTINANTTATAATGFTGLSVDSATLTTSGTGTISILAYGGNDTTTANHHGILLQNSGKMTTTGSGLINIAGYAGNSSTGGVGIAIRSGSQITSAGTLLQMGGYASSFNASSSGSARGVEVSGTGSQIAGSSAAALIITGVGGNGSNNNNQGIYVGTTSSANAITSVNGQIILQGTAGAGSGFFGNDPDGLFVDKGTVSTTGLGTITVVADQTEINSTGAINAGGNSVVLRPNTTSRPIDVGTVTTGSLSFFDSELDLIVAGTLFIGNSASGAITVSANISHGNNLTLTTGAGLTSIGGIAMAVNKSLTVSAVGTITLTGGGSPFSATGSGSIGLTTQGEISISGSAAVTTADGALTLSANQQASPTSGTFTGINLSSGSITVSGNGVLTLLGRGGDAGRGIALASGSVVQGGKLGTTQIQGTAGTSTAGLGIGVDLSGKLSTLGSDLQITGQGNTASTGNSNNGIGLHATATITMTTGATQIMGTAGGTAGAGLSAGVSGGNAQITSSAAVVLIGKGGAGSGTNNDGVSLSSTTISTSGNISITGTEGSGTSLAGITVQAGKISTGASAGTITMVADTLAIGSSPNINTANTATFRPLTVGRAINLGGADTIGSALGLSDFELDSVSAGTIQIGNSSAGTITVSALVDRASSTALALTTGAAINLNAGLDSGGGNIMLTSVGAITQTAGAVLANGGTLTLAAAGGQTATFVTANNKATSLVIPTGVTGLINGSFDPSGAVQVDGTLGGTNGSVGTTTVTGTGRIAPGNSPGKLTTGNIVFNSASVFAVELNGTTAGSSYDQLAVSGTVNLGGATLQGSLGFVPTPGQVFKIIDNDGTGDAVTGTFNGYIEGASVPVGPYNFTISYQGGDGNDVTLTALTPPTVTSVVLDNGPGAGGLDATQRSEVRRIIVTFSQPVNFSGPLVNAFSLSRSATSASAGTTGPVSLTPTPTSGPTSSVTLTFTGTYADVTGSLVDGIYDFVIDASKVSGTGGQLNGSGAGAGTNYSVTGSSANKWFRFFGDQDGNAAVDQTDYLVFRNALSGGPNVVFDFDGSGDVDQVDYLNFRNRLSGSP
ncbi:MAG: beta strand repeat-containing protein [Gemmataceae bacterium]